METIGHPVVEWGVASRTLKGETVSGDRPLVRVAQDYVLVGAVDGLGHGEEAVSAAMAAVRTLEDIRESSVIRLIKLCHERLQQTRGVVMSIATFNPADDTMTWIGVGNVEGLLARADPEASPRYESLLLRNGVVGARLPLLHAALLPVMQGDTLIFSTDGVRNDIDKLVTSGLPPQQLADRIMTQGHKGTDDALVLVVRYRGGAS